MGGPSSLIETRPKPSSGRVSLLRSFGLGIITGAADDDCSAVGTYAQTGAAFGYSLLWTAPFLLPMMVTVVYLSSKLGQVTGQGLFSAIRCNYSKRFLYVALVGVLIGNTIEAGADIGGIAEALRMLVSLPHALLVIAVGVISLVLQIWGSYRLISNVFRFLSLALLAYVAAMFFARPNLHAVAAGFLHPGLKFDHNVLAILVAMIGTSLSAYLLTWQSNQEVEEKIAEGKVKLRQRRGTSERRLHKTLLDVLFGMFFSVLVVFAIIIATGATLFQSGQHNIQSATDAAKALTPLAGDAAGLLFAAGIVGVGFLAIPVITAGTAYNICQSFDWRNGLHLRPGDGKHFYGSIAAVIAVATGINFLGINPMKALVFAGIVQGFSTPPLLLLILLMTNSPRIMGDKTNTRVANLFGWATTVVVFTASGALIWSWVAH